MSPGAIDYVILAVAAGGAVAGLFIGFSGSLAFLAGSVSAAVAARFGWAFSAGFIESPWARAAAVAVGAILAFGIVRWLVRKFVHGLVAQPGDALLGAAAFGAVCLGLSLAAVHLLVHFGFIGEDSGLSLFRGIVSNAFG